MNWSRAASSALIEHYRENPCLWCPETPHYRTKPQRLEALKKICNAVQPLRPGTSVDEIKLKINGLRTQFSAECNKIRADPYYKSTLWCYPSLQFLEKYFRSRPTIYKQTSVVQSQAMASNLDGLQVEIVNETSATGHLMDYSNSNDAQLKQENDKIDDVIELISDFEDDLTYEGSNDYEQPSTTCTENVHVTNKQMDTTSVNTFEQTSPELPNECILVNNQETPKEPKTKITVLNFDSTSAGQTNTNPVEISVTKFKKHKKQHRRTSSTVYSSSDSSDSNHIPNEKRIKTCRDRLKGFGNFVETQMRTITDEATLVRLQHVIQNAIMEAQLKQLEKKNL